MTLLVDGTLGVSGVDGTAATPAVAGVDNTTGLFFGTGIIGFSSSGTEDARIAANSHLGIGTTTPPSKITIAAGNTTVAPLEFTTGTLNTTSANGRIEYTDPNFYAVPTNNVRAALGTNYIWVQGVNRASTAQAATQGIFGAAGTSTLGISLGVARYRYMLRARCTSTAVVTNVGFALGGTAVLGLHSFNAITKISITNSLTSGTVNSFSNAKTSLFTTADVITASSTAAASFFDFHIDGIIDVTTAGTVIFQHNQSGATAVLTWQLGSYIELMPIGTGAALGAANTNISGWA